MRSGSTASTFEQYEKDVSFIIKKGLPVHTTLWLLLTLSSKYKFKVKNKNKKKSKGRKK